MQPMSFSIVRIFSFFFLLVVGVNICFLLQFLIFDASRNVWFNEFFHDSKNIHANLQWLNLSQKKKIINNVMKSSKKKMIVKWINIWVDNHIYITPFKFNRNYRKCQIIKSIDKRITNLS